VYLGALTGAPQIFFPINCHGIFFGVVRHHYAEY
jgi:hypothetical protein